MSASEIIGNVTVCTWRDDGISITTNRGLFTSLSWSPSGKYIAIATQNEGVWLLDLTDHSFSSITTSPQWWHRPIWGGSDNVVFLGSTDGVHAMRQSDGEWRETSHTFQDQNLLWQGRVDHNGCLGIARYNAISPEDQSAILHANRTMELVQEVHSHLPDGHLLSLDLGECPVWWERGKSVLVVAYRHGTPFNFVVDLETGLAAQCELRDRVVRRLCESSDPHLIIGIVGDLHRDWEADTNEHLVSVSDDHQVSDIGQVPGIGVYHSIALSPDHCRIALIESDLTLNIIPLPARVQ